jgi:hypothetical protein
MVPAPCQGLKVPPPPLLLLLQVASTTAMIIYSLVWDFGETAGVYLAGAAGAGGVNGFRSAAAVLGVATGALALTQWALQVGGRKAGALLLCAGAVLLLLRPGTL